MIGVLLEGPQVAIVILTQEGSHPLTRQDA
jgi:hypothetical protein